MTNIQIKPGYRIFLSELREIKEGRRGWMSLTRKSKELGTSKAFLQELAEAYGLAIDPSHGKYGMIAYRRR